MTSAPGPIIFPEERPEGKDQGNVSNSEKLFPQYKDGEDKFECLCVWRKGGGVFNTVLEKIVLSRRPIYALTRDLYRDEILNYV